MSKPKLLKVGPQVFLDELMTAMHWDVRQNIQEGVIGLAAYRDTRFFDEFFVVNLNVLTEYDRTEFLKEVRELTDNPSVKNCRWIKGRQK